MITLFLEYFWIGPLLWIILYISDYSFTVVCAKLYRQQNIVAFEGSYELNPIFQKDIDSQKKLISSKFILYLVLFTSMLILIWFIADSTLLQNMYLFLLGFLVLVQLVVHIRHINNYFLFKYAVTVKDVQGYVYPNWMKLRMSALDLVLFAILFFIVFILSIQLFFLGGAFGCFRSAIRQYRLSKKAIKAA